MSQANKCHECGGHVEYEVGGDRVYHYCLKPSCKLAWTLFVTQHEHMGPQGKAKIASKGWGQVLKVFALADRLDIFDAMNVTGFLSTCAMMNQDPEHAARSLIQLYNRCEDMAGPVRLSRLSEIGEKLAEATEDTTDWFQRHMSEGARL